MPSQQPERTPPSRLDQEVERERHQRELNDEARSGAANADADRLKDARETGNAGHVRH